MPITVANPDFAERPRGLPLRFVFRAMFPAYFADRRGCYGDRTVTAIYPGNEAPVRRLLVLFLSVPLVLAAFAAPASAADHSAKFTKTKTWHSKPLNRWFKLQLTGTIEAESWTTGMGRSTNFFFGRPELKSPTLKVTVYKDAAMTKKTTVRKLELRQYYYDKSCKTTPSISVSASTSKALSIGASATRHCAKFTTAYRASEYGKHSVYTQSTSGAAVVWKGKAVSWSAVEQQTKKPKKTVCVTPEFEMQPYVGSNKDDLLKSNFSDICISNK